MLPLLSRVMVASLSEAWCSPARIGGTGAADIEDGAAPPAEALPLPSPRLAAQPQPPPTPNQVGSAFVSARKLSLPDSCGRQAAPMTAPQG